VRTGVVDIDALVRDRDQLFAEAMVLHGLGTQWWPDKKFERDHIVLEQEQRFEADAWEDYIRKHLGTVTKTTVADVARLALNIQTAKLGRAEQNRICAAMERIGWGRGKRTGGARWWTKV